MVQTVGENQSPDGNEYRYYLAVHSDEIVSEALYWRAIGGKKTGTVFERDRSEITLGPSISKASINRSVNPKMPYLSFLAINYDIAMIADVQSWFGSCIIRTYANPVVESQVLLSKDEKVREGIIQALNDMGIEQTDEQRQQKKACVASQKAHKGFHACRAPFRRRFGLSPGMLPVSAVPQKAKEQNIPTHPMTAFVVTYRAYLVQD